MPQRKDLPYKALQRMEALALGQFDAMLERGQSLIESQILESAPDPEEITAAEASEILSKSTKDRMQVPFSQEVLHFYAFGIPKELESAAEEARSRTLQDFLVLSSGQTSREESEAARVANVQEGRRTSLWIELYNGYRSKGLTRDKASREIEKSDAYKRSKALSEAALAIKVRTQEAWEELRRTFQAKWEPAMEYARSRGVAVPEGPEQLGLFWSVANNR